MKIKNSTFPWNENLREGKTPWVIQGLFSKREGQMAVWCHFSRWEGLCCTIWEQRRATSLVSSSLIQPSKAVWGMWMSWRCHLCSTGVIVETWSRCTRSSTEESICIQTSSLFLLHQTALESTNGNSRNRGLSRGQEGRLSVQGWSMTGTVCLSQSLVVTLSINSNPDWTPIGQTSGPTGKNTRFHQHVQHKFAFAPKVSAHVRHKWMTKMSRKWSNKPKRWEK